MAYLMKTIIYNSTETFILLTVLSSVKSLCCLPLFPGSLLLILDDKYGIQAPDSKVHGANMRPIWGRQDLGGSHVGPMNLAIWGLMRIGTGNKIEKKNMAPTVHCL